MVRLQELSQTNPTMFRPLTSDANFSPRHLSASTAKFTILGSARCRSDKQAPCIARAIAVASLMLEVLVVIAVPRLRTGTSARCTQTPSNALCRRRTALTFWLVVHRASRTRRLAIVLTRSLHKNMMDSVRLSARPARLYRYARKLCRGFSLPSR